MLLSISTLTFIAISALLLGAAILGTAIYFFMSSRRSLSKVLKKPEPHHYDYEFDVPEQIAVAIPQPQPQKQQVQKPAPEPVVQEKGRKGVRTEQDTIHSLKEIIAQQQQMLGNLLEKAEETQHSELAKENEQLQDKVTDLELDIEHKVQEIGSLKHQLTAGQKMSERIEEVYREFDVLQQRIKDLEYQAGRTNELTMELEDVKDEQEQLKRDLLRKQTKLDETFAENQRLQFQLNEVEDKLAEANLQRQQLQKKVQFLQEMNTDFHSISDTNKRLQTELRRIGELENMLQMIADERDQLLRRKQ
jgi:chromosome segregation ATPase